MSLKNREQFSSTLDTNLKIKLKELSKETNVPISKLLDEAVTLLLKQRGLPRDRNITFVKFENGEFIEIKDPTNIE